MAHEFPTLQPNQYALLQAEAATGIVLTIVGEWAIGTAECYRLFSSLAELEVFAQAQIQAYPAIECVAFDHDQNCIKVFRNEMVVQANSNQHQKPWCRFW